MRCEVPLLVRRLLVEDSGQDLIEYGLLTAIVTLSGVTIFATIRDQMADLYTSWRADFQEEIKWIPPDPGS